MKSEKGPSSSKTCLLERKGECSDDSFLTFLNDKEKKTLQKKTSEFFRDKNRVPFLALIKDALHWEYVHSPEQAAQFLKDYVLKENATVRMKCWYDREFKNIPWLNRFKSSSQMAFYNIHNCFFSTPSENRMNNMCSCLDRLPSYKVLNYQIQAPTKIFYVNGEFDSQTPLKGAQSHFEQQKSETKAFLKICGAGHLPIRDTASATDHSISANEVFSKILSGDVKGFLRINSYCK